MNIIKLFFSAVLYPPSINEWQSMNSIIEMFVTGVAYLFREISLLSLAITALIAFYLTAKLIVQEIQSALIGWIQK